MGDKYDATAENVGGLTPVTVDETTEKYIQGTLPEQYLEMDDGKEGYNFIDAIDDDEAEELYSDLFDDGFFDAAYEVAKEYDLGSVKEYGAKAVDMFENACVQFSGDRVTALSHVGATVFALGVLGEESIADYTMFYTGLFSLFGYPLTGFGGFTKETYQETEKHILENGELDPEYVAERMETEHWLEGYSQEQGVYLAARKHDELDTFNEVHDEVSSIKIPHF